jgi:hypothetical protein
MMLPSFLSLMAKYIILTCGILTVIMFLHFITGLQNNEGVQGTLLLISFIAGVIIAAEGLAAINISSAVSGENARNAAMLAGLQPF